MEYSDDDPSFRARFLETKFDSNAFIQSIGIIKIVFLIFFFFLVQHRKPLVAEI